MLDGIWATRIFFLVRFIAAFLVAVVYILVAAAIQFWFVSWFGETTFNYISGGLISLLVGATVCIVLGRLTFMFVSGWHVATFALHKDIQARELPMLDAGIAVFKKNFTSFAAIYTLEHLITKFSKEGADKVWGLLEDVPYIGSLSRFSKNPIVSRIASDVLSTSFDAMVYYTVRYSKPGIADDFQQLPTALRKYIFSLPSILVTSLAVYLLFYVLPRILKWVAIVFIILHSGILAGILQLTLLYPIFFVLRVVVFDPVERLALLTCFAKKCDDDVDTESAASKTVEEILKSAGISELFTEDNLTTEDEISEDAKDFSEEETDTPEQSEEKPEKQRESNTVNLNDFLQNSRAKPENSGNGSPVSLNDWAKNSPFKTNIGGPFNGAAGWASTFNTVLRDRDNPSVQEDPKVVSVSEEDEGIPLSRISSIAEEFSFDDFNRDGESEDDLLGGGTIDQF